MLNDSVRRQVSRREAINLLGMGAGLGVVSLWTAGAERLAAWSGPATGVRATSPAFPKGAIIRTLLKDLPPEMLADGVTLPHEHFSEDLQPPKDGPPKKERSATTDLALMIDEANLAVKDGVVCVVDASTFGQERQLESLQRIAHATKLHIVAGGGFYLERTYPPDLAAKSEDQIADELVLDAERNRFGLFGEIGQKNEGPMSAMERKVFRAVGKAHVRTNLPILTHNGYFSPAYPADAALRQLEVFESVGVKLPRVAMGHMDNSPEQVMKEVAKRGAFVVFDQLNGRVPNEVKGRLIRGMLDAGYASNLLLSSDFNGRRSSARPGYGNVVTMFAPKLRDAGVNEDTLRMLLRDNPRRFLAFVPKKST